MKSFVEENMCMTSSRLRINNYLVVNTMFGRYYKEAHITMRFYPTATSRSAFQISLAMLLRFGELVQSYRTLQSLFRLLADQF